jgi:formylglycine-generating enzyme required for sulfatase activity
MGYPEDEPERASVEGPRHRVRLEGFQMGQTTVTQAQWRVETAAGGFQSN